MHHVVLDISECQTMTKSLSSSFSIVVFIYYIVKLYYKLMLQKHFVCQYTGNTDKATC